jgi:hypothetical protein
MQATVRLDEYLRNEKLRKGQLLTFIHYDTGFPAPVTFIRRCVRKDKIRVERNPNSKDLWTVDISACYVQITI